LLLVNLTKQNLQGVPWKEFTTTWQNKIKKIVNGGTEGDHTVGHIFGTKNTQYLRNTKTQIYQIHRLFLTQPFPQNRGRIVSKF